MKRDEFDSLLNSLLLSAEKLIPQKDLPELPYMELSPTVHDWYDFEHELWEIGENIKAKRGRQSFVMLLGKKRFLHYADRIASILPDDDIDGHIISTLYKMGAEYPATKIIQVKEKTKSQPTLAVG